MAAILGGGEHMHSLKDTPQSFDIFLISKEKALFRK